MLVKSEWNIEASPEEVYDPDVMNMNLFNR